MPCTARGEVRSHINYFSSHPPTTVSLPPTTRVSHSPTRASASGDTGLETNLSFSFPLALLSHTISPLSLFLRQSVCLSVCLHVRPSVRLSLYLSHSLPLSLFLFLLFVLSPCGFSRISSPYFSPFPPLLPRTLMPYGKSIFRRSPHCQPFPSGGEREGGRGDEEGVCNVFATYFISSTHLCNYYCIKKPSATSRQRQLHYLRTRYLHWH